VSSQDSRITPGVSVLVGIATYNEIENLPDLVSQIFEAVPQCHILVVDDDSPDGTGVWCDEFARSNPRLTCIHRAGKQGLGTASVALLRYVIQTGDFEWLVNMDADHSHRPVEIPRLLRAAVVEEPPVDVVIGSRYVPGGQIVGWPLRRLWTSRLVNLAARWGLGIPAQDCSGSFRCYRVTTLRRLDLERLKSRGYSIYEELLVELGRLGARFVEVPISFVERERGTTKVGFREVFQAAGRIIWLVGRVWFRGKP